MKRATEPFVYNGENVFRRIRPACYSTESKTVLKGTFLLTLLAAFFLSCMPQKQHLLYVGTYTDKESEGIYCYEYNPGSGDFVLKHVTPNKENPSFLAIHPGGEYLYAVSEVSGSELTDSGSLTAYRILKDGKLEKINKESTGANHPCHVAISPDGRTAVASNYTSGSISVFDVREDGSLSGLKQLIRHAGSGPDSARQKGPHAHSALFSSDGKLLVTADLGTDSINFYTFAPGNGSWEPGAQGAVSVSPGFGPRHFDFSPDGRFIYVMNEMGSAVSVLQMKNDRFEVIETVSSLSPDFSGTSYGADIHLSADGRFVYCSNRGLNSVAIFSRDEASGRISLIANEPVQGDWPRNFAIDPQEKYLLVANQRSNTITVFSIDRDSGLLTFCNQSKNIPSPVCLKFLVR